MSNQEEWPPKGPQGKLLGRMVLGLRANFVSAKESDETMAMAMGSLGWASTKTSKHQLWKNILPHSFNYRHNPRKSHSSSSSLWDLSPTNWGTQLCKHVTAFASGMGEIGGGREQVSGFVRASSSSAATTMKGDQKGEDVISFFDVGGRFFWVVSIKLKFAEICTLLSRCWVGKDVECNLFLTCSMNFSWWLMRRTEVLGFGFWILMRWWWWAMWGWEILGSFVGLCELS